MRKCGGSERMKKFGLLGIYRTSSWIQIGSIYEPGQIAILNGFHDFDRILTAFGILLWI